MFFNNNYDNDNNTMIENRKKHRQNSHPIIHYPTSEGVSEVSERVSAAEGASEASSPEQANKWASERANERAKRAVWSKQTSKRCERTDERMAQYYSLFLAVIDHSVLQAADALAMYHVLSAIFFHFSQNIRNSTRVWPTDGRMNRPTDGHTLL